MDTVEILLATYNGAKFIREQLESIVLQDYENWVVRACDDASSDDTYNILMEYQTKYPNKFVVERNEKGTGSAKNNFMNLIKGSNSDYIMCCDQDDVWLPNKISLTIQKMKETEENDLPVLVHTDLKVVDQELNVLSESFFAYSQLNKDFNYRDALIQNSVTGCTLMMNRPLISLMRKVTDVESILMHDWLAALLATAVGKVAFVDCPTMLYRQHSVNSVGAKPYGLSLFVSKVKNNAIRKSLLDTTVQAGEISKTYRDELGNELYQLTYAYSELFTKGKLYRINFYIKNKVMKKGLPRKIAQIIMG